MITIVHATMMLGLIVLPLLRKTKKAKATIVVSKNDCDTTEARYAINSNGYLEKVAGSKVSTDGVID